MLTNHHPNGVNVQQLVDTVQAIQATPDLARFKFRATNKWIAGGHSRTNIQSFFGAGSEDSLKTKARANWPNKKPTKF